MSQYCTQCGTENVNDAKFCKSCGAKFSVTIEENQYKTPVQSEKPASTYNVKIVEYSSMTEFKRKYTFISKNIVRDQSTWEDYSIKIKENVIYLCQGVKIVKAARINGSIDLNVIQDLKKVTATERMTDEPVPAWWKGWALLGLFLCFILANVFTEDKQMIILFIYIIGFFLVVLFGDEVNQTR
jgi:zinc-ribbon domain